MNEHDAELLRRNRASDQQDVWPPATTALGEFGERQLRSLVTTGRAGAQREAARLAAQAEQVRKDLDAAVTDPLPNIDVIATASRLDHWLTILRTLQEVHVLFEADKEPYKREEPRDTMLDAIARDTRKPGTTDGHYHTRGPGGRPHPDWESHDKLPLHRHDMTTGRTEWRPGGDR